MYLMEKFFKWKKLKAKNMLSRKSERIKCEWSLEPSLWNQNVTMQQQGRKGVQWKNEGNKKGQKLLKKGQKRKLASNTVWNLKTLRKNHRWKQDFPLQLWKMKPLQAHWKTEVIKSLMMTQKWQHDKIFRKNDTLHHSPHVI